MRLSFVNGHILLADRMVAEIALVMTDGRIAAIAPSDPAPDAVIDLDGGYLLPGFIDTQVNGGGGILLNDEPTVAGVTTIAAAHRRFGTTGLFPTLISDTPGQIVKAIDAIDAAIRSGVPGVLGVHLEGPCINADKRGIHDASRFRPLDEEMIAVLTRPGAGKRIVTLAPELAPPGAIRRLVEAGVIVAAAHSMATYDETRAAIADGLRGYTHLFNAMTQLTSREPGLVGAALDHADGIFGLIVDGVHVHPASMRVALHARGDDGVMLVTDAMSGVGSAATHFTLFGRRIEIHDGICRADDGTLAGSNLDMASAVRNAMSMLHVDIATASRMASTVPARFAGLENRTGTIAVGLAADLVQLTHDMQVVRTWISGIASEPA